MKFEAQVIDGVLCIVKGSDVVERLPVWVTVSEAVAIADRMNACTPGGPVSVCGLLGSRRLFHA